MIKYSEVLEKMAEDQRIVDLTKRTREKGWRPTSDDMDILKDMADTYGLENKEIYGNKALAPYINGMGGDRDNWPKVLADWWMPGSTVAAGIHDIDYKAGGTDADRDQADSRFLRNLNRIAAKDFAYSDKNSAYRNFINWIKTTFLPKMGYYSVRVGGKGHFNYGGRPIANLETANA